MAGEFDSVIMGGGTSGCVLAGKLSADPQNRVLMIESGVSDWFPFLHVPGYMHKLLHTHYMTGYQTVPQRHMNMRSCLIPTGHVLGGGSTVNAMIYSRGNPEDYRIWRQMDNESWDWEDVLPYFLAMENNATHHRPLHGQGGPVHVQEIPTPNETSLAFVEARVEAGLPRNRDFAGPVQDGAGLFQNTAHKGRRWSAVRAHLDPARGRPKLTVITSARTRRILVEAAAYAYSDRAQSHPDISRHFLPLFILDFGRQVPPGYGMTLHNNNLRPKSRGEIRLASADPKVKPLVDPNYLSHPDDIRVPKECVRWARRVMQTKAMAPYYDGELLPGKDVQTEEELEAHIRAHAETDFHPVGAC